MGRFVSPDSESGRRLTGAKGSRVVPTDCRECKRIGGHHHSDCAIGKMEALNKALDQKRQEKLAKRKKK